MINNIEYNVWPGTLAIANEYFLSQCSNLYSNHYGKWGDNGLHPGEHIKLSKDRIREWLQNELSTIYYATINDELIGYAIAVSIKEKNYGIVTWVTQLVVHKDYRKNGIAKNLLFSIWGFSNHYAWGIVSANPYAIRALEKATRRRATPLRIKKTSIKLKNVGRQNVPFITDDVEIIVNKNLSAINTSFFVSHDNTKTMIANVDTGNTPWLLGLIDEGWEWFAFTFNDQEQISLSQNEIENMVSTSDSVVKKAYSRMNLDPNNQSWMKHTSKEVDYILNKVILNKHDLVYDLGCGAGRHSIELAKKDYSVIGLDYVAENVKLVNSTIKTLDLKNIKIEEADCRNYLSAKKASVVLCLYDVIGTFSNDDDNFKIIKTAYDLLTTDGTAIFSVMNYESTLARAKNTFIFENEANKLLDLKASNTMENTGNIFNPEYYLVDTDTHLIYRKEQFSTGNQLPIELIVRDRRFTMTEIKALCQKAGFKIQEANYTSAADWNISYNSIDKNAKEILLICKK